MADLYTIVQKVLEDLDLRIDETGTSISVEQLPAIEAIPSQMRQLFFNLLQNAIKFRKKSRELVIKITQHLLGAAEKKRFQLLPGNEYYMIKNNRQRNWL